MITVDCRDVEPIKRELLVYVADQIGAIPSLKIHEFMLSPIDDGDVIDAGQVITVIKEYLDSIGEAKNFAVIGRDQIIMIKSLSGRTIQRENKTQEHMFTCTHCGFVTQYEVEHNNHMKIHYL